MYNVMLVDDDFPVIEFWSQAIHWEQLGFCFIGGFESGYQALDMAKELVPDLLITDIGMPDMNGLELIQSIRKVNPRLQSIILSCHDDFNYAQQAVKLDVHDYLLKETLEPETMMIVLERVKERMIKESDRDQISKQIGKFANDNRSLLKTKFLREIINNPLTNYTAWSVKAKEFGINIEQFSYIPVLCYIDHYYEAKQKFISEDILLFAVENIIDEILVNKENGAVFGYDSRQYMLLFHCSDSIKVNVYEQMNRIMKQISDALNRYLKLDCCFIVGSICREFQDLKDNMTGLLDSRDRQFYISSGAIVKNEAHQFSNNDLFLHYSQAVEEFRMAFIHKDLNQMKEVASKWIAFIQDENFKPEMVREWTLKIMLEIKIGFSSQQGFQSSYSVETLHDSIVNIETLDQLHEFMIRFSKKIMTLMSRMPQYQKRTEIVKAQRYVMKHLDKKITLSDVAELLFLNPNYFSRMYKKETGENFIDYVTRLKIEKAKELLKHTDKTIEEISVLTGFENKSYFFKIFKNVVYVAPHEYRGTPEEK